MYEVRVMLPLHMCLKYDVQLHIKLFIYVSPTITFTQL